MSDHDDLELEALQRKLDDAFETTRPRRGFEDELWLRMQSRRPIWTRIQDGLSGLFQGIREAPAVSAAAVAVLLVVVIGAGIFTLGGFGRGGAGTTASLGAGAPTHYGAQQASSAFGPLPLPPPKAATGDQLPGVPNNNYPGAVSLTWTGHLDLGITSAPVFRYYEPTSAIADEFATSLGAASATRPAGYLGAYSSSDLTLQVRGSIQTPPLEPFFYLFPIPPAPGSAPASASDASSSYLAAHSLAPSWPNTIVTETAGGVVKVSYLRQFAVSSYGSAYLVDRNGVRYGLEVDVKSGQPVSVKGPLPLSLDSANYPIITAEQAVRSALATSASSTTATLSPPPALNLDKAELVYVLVVAGDHSFYEPAVLFSGTFSLNGTVYTKRVLVPAVDPSQRIP